MPSRKLKLQAVSGDLNLCIPPSSAARLNDVLGRCNGEEATNIAGRILEAGELFREGALHKGGVLHRGLLLRYSGMSSSQLSIMKTRLTYSLMLFFFFLFSKRSKGARRGMKSRARNSSCPSTEKCCRLGDMGVR